MPQPTKYNRLARSLKALLEIVDLLQTRGAGFRSLVEDIDTTSTAGRLIFHGFALIAQFERERTIPPLPWPSFAPPFSGKFDPPQNWQ